MKVVLRASVEVTNCHFWYVLLNIIGGKTAILHLSTLPAIFYAQSSRTCGNINKSIRRFLSLGEESVIPGGPAQHKIWCFLSFFALQTNYKGKQLRVITFYLKYK